MMLKLESTCKLTKIAVCSQTLNAEKNAFFLFKCCINYVGKAYLKLSEKNFDFASQCCKNPLVFN